MTLTIDLILAFTLMHIAMSFSPGPAVLLVTTQAMARGVRPGLATSLGILAGNTIYFGLSVFGLGAVLVSSAFLFALIKWAGAAYLIWLGITTLRQARRVAEVSGPPRAADPAGPAFRQGLAKQLANPKSVLFFGALLPQFITPGVTGMADYGLMLAIMHATELPVLAGYAVLGATGGAFVRGPVGLVWRERVCGLSQIAVGGLLAGLRRTA
ncbi:LysE family translocator [Maricaulis sp.]|uniref:LysE family translocator n=1 Tax=Maricaulis sp. TaxID=1486257 RepID=UPI00260226DD|nr:LysE family translocator [Maricaulis sp.]